MDHAISRLLLRSRVLRSLDPCIKQHSRVCLALLLLAAPLQSIGDTNQDTGNNISIMATQGFQGSKAVIHNPYHAPVHIQFDQNLLADGSNNVVVPANQSITVPLRPELPDYLNSRWIFGTPTIRPGAKVMLPPFSGRKNRVISQAFGGDFSHTGEENFFAVDIKMPIGTPIHAAHDGVVFEVIEHHTASGLKPAYKTQANAISVLHDDGYYSVYAHLKPFSSKVREGDRVTAGQLLAYSGDTGFVRAPHLHFVVMRNKDFNTQSIAFEFLQGGKLLKPKRGVWLSPEQQ